MNMSVHFHESWASRTAVIITLFVAQELVVGHALLIIEASPSHSDTPYSVGLLWASVQPVAQTVN